MKESKGEKLVRTLLEKENIPFEQEKSFSNCKGYRGTRLRFDFYLKHPLFGPTLLEWHGRHHYEYTPYFHKKRDNFNYRRHMDTLKCSYALRQDIPMFVIPYTEYLKIKNFNDLFQEEFRVRQRQHAIINNPLQKNK